MHFKTFLYKVAVAAPLLHRGQTIYSNNLHRICNSLIKRIPHDYVFVQYKRRVKIKSYLKKHIKNITDKHHFSLVFEFV